MKLKQRQANKAALEMAAAMVRDADLEELFADFGTIGDTDAEEEHNYAVMDKAQKYAAGRIERLIAP